MQFTRESDHSVIFLALLCFFLSLILVKGQNTTPPLLTKIFTNAIVLNNLIVIDPDGNFEQVRKMHDELLRDITLFHKQYGNMKLPSKSYVMLAYCEKASVTIVNNSVLRESRNEIKCQLKGTTDAIFIQKYLYDLSTKKKIAYRHTNNYHMEYST
jgi:hypothetical protein